MKIRIKGNSIRLRLTQSEIDVFAEEGIIKDQIQFGTTIDSSLTYSLEKGEFVGISALFEGNEIRIRVSEEIGDNWSKTDRVGIENEVLLGKNQTLKILIEKDFKCLTTRKGEDESDNFPHPHESTLKC